MNTYDKQLTKSTEYYIYEHKAQMCDLLGLP